MRMFFVFVFFNLGLICGRVNICGVFWNRMRLFMCVWVSEWGRACPPHTHTHPITGDRREGAEPRRRDCNAIAAQLKSAITHTHSAHTSQAGPTLLSGQSAGFTEPLPERGAKTAERRGAAGGGTACSLFLRIQSALLFIYFITFVPRWEAASDWGLRGFESCYRWTFFFFGFLITLLPENQPNPRVRKIREREDAEL